MVQTAVRAGVVALHARHCLASMKRDTSSFCGAQSQIVRRIKFQILTNVDK